MEKYLVAAKFQELTEKAFLTFPAAGGPFPLRICRFNLHEIMVIYRKFQLYVPLHSLNFSLKVKMVPDLHNFLTIWFCRKLRKWEIYCYFSGNIKRESRTFVAIRRKPPKKWHPELPCPTLIWAKCKRCMGGVAEIKWLAGFIRGKSHC